MERIKTRFAANVDVARVLPEYPRPQLVREGWMNLNGLYDYAVTPHGAQQPERFEGQILVPFCIESSLSGVERALKPDELLWYRRTFELSEAFYGKKVILHFGAVDWQCKVWVNGKLVGTHTGGYCPFSFEITGYINAHNNELTVCVYDPTDEGWQQRGKQVLKTHGFWYTATSGIWQTVWLEAVDRCYIREVKAVPDIDRGLFTLNTKLYCDEGYQLKLRVFDEGKEIIAREISTSEEIDLPDAKLWSPESPFLYDLQLELSTQGELRDTVRSYVGMRKCSIGRDEKGLPRLLLNNKPYFQRGLLDQGYWCESLLTPPTDEAMVYDIEVAKRLGFNMLRKHIKVEPARWYYHCDRLGMLVWQDMPNGGSDYQHWFVTYLATLLNWTRIPVKDIHARLLSRTDEDGRQEFVYELRDMIKALYNHPSIVTWVPFNEGWGQFSTKEVTDFIHRLDPSRLVDSASGWFDQKGGDLCSLHYYFFTLKFRPEPVRALALTEFGGYSWQVPGHSYSEKLYGYGKYDSRQTLTEGYRRLLSSTILPAVKQGISATIYTQLSDVEEEVNGLYTYDREILKPDGETVRKLNQELKDAVNRH